MSTSAESLMTNRFLRISTAHTLREALGLILYGEERNMDTGAIVVIDREGEYAGILTPDCLVQGFGKSDEDSYQTREGFIDNVNRHLPDTIDTVMLRDLPRLNKDDSFAEVIQKMLENEYECLPVLEVKRVVGLVYATDLFKAAANLALTPGQEGIDIDGKD